MDSDFLSSLCTCAQIVAAVYLYAAPLPRREPRVSAGLVTLVLLVVWAGALELLVPAFIEVNAWSSIAVFFSCSLVMAWAMTLVFFDTSPWAALFCATSGYTLQNLANIVAGTVHTLLPGVSELPLYTYLDLVVPYVVVYAVAWCVYVRRIERDGLDLIAPQAMLAMMAVVIFAVIAYDAVVKQNMQGLLEDWLYVCVRLSNLMLCGLVLALEYELLYGRRMRAEVVAVTQFMEAEKEQYRISKETIDAINLKCHDIRHQIRQLGEGAGNVSPAVLDDIEREVVVYDAAVRTGYEPLDVILTEKGLTCQREGITLTCLADGSCLSFMAPTDLYSLMGNALDNAIEAAGAVADPERRSVSVMVRRSGDMAAIHVENYFEGTRSFKNGLPQTTKADKANHGFGSRSMRLVTERYGGVMHARAEDGVYHLNVALPLA